jgi:hypothetical protein
MAASSTSRACVASVASRAASTAARHVCEALLDVARRRQRRIQQRPTRAERLDVHTPERSTERDLHVDDLAAHREHARAGLREERARFGDVGERRDPRGAHALGALDDPFRDDELLLRRREVGLGLAHRHPRAGRPKALLEGHGACTRLARLSLAGGRPTLRARQIREVPRVTELHLPLEAAVLFAQRAQTRHGVETARRRSHPDGKTRGIPGQARVLTPA